MDIKISGWNYVPVGKIKAKEGVKELKQLGLNYPMSYKFYEGSSKEEAIAFLDECDKQGLKTIWDDSRIYYNVYLTQGEEVYYKNVKKVVEDFGWHPALYGFMVGDEPVGKDFDKVARSLQICNELCPNKVHFLNLFPFWNEDNFYDTMGVHTGLEYSEKVSKLIKDSGIKMIAYDYYGQCCYFDREVYQDAYFRNLWIFGKAARENNIELFNSVLSVGHWSLRVPTEDDFRWQISTSIASGATGLAWFFIYERTLDHSFRNSPIDLFYERTSTFESLSRQNRTVLQYLAPVIKDFEFAWSKHFNKSYGGFELFTYDENITEISYIINPSPLIVSKFMAKDGRIMMMIVNMNQSEPVKARIKLGERFDNKCIEEWFAPGQMEVYISSK